MQNMVHILEVGQVFSLVHKLNMKLTAAKDNNKFLVVFFSSSSWKLVGNLPIVRWKVSVSSQHRHEEGEEEKLLPIEGNVRQPMWPGNWTDC